MQESIPGLAEAIWQEQLNREMAFQPAPMPICGVKVRHMNARHFMILETCGNRFLVGGPIRPEDVAFFLWVLSPEYRANDVAAREKFITEQVRPLLYVDWFFEALRAIAAHVEAVFQDAPAKNGDGSRKFYTAPLAGLVDLFALEYGWTADYVAEAPLALLYQMARRIEMRRNPKAPQFNPSDRLVGRWLARRQAEADAANMARN